MFILAIVVAPTLSACSYPAEFRFPLSAPGTVAYDDRLIGTWLWVNADGEGAGAATLTVRPVTEGILDIVGSATWIDAGGGSPHYSHDELDMYMFHWLAHASDVDGTTYYNARVLDSISVRSEAGALPETRSDQHFVDHPERGYWIVYPEIIDDDYLELYLIYDDTEFKKLGLQTTNIDCGDACEFSIIDISSEDILDLIKLERPKPLFEGGYLLTRVEGRYPLRRD
jgi:hypothetical protein